MRGTTPVKITGVQFVRSPSPGHDTCPTPFGPVAVQRGPPLASKFGRKRSTSGGGEAKHSSVGNLSHTSALFNRDDNNGATIFNAVDHQSGECSFDSSNEKQKPKLEEEQSNFFPKSDDQFLPTIHSEESSQSTQFSRSMQSTEGFFQSSQLAEFTQSSQTAEFTQSSSL